MHELIALYFFFIFALGKAKPSGLATSATKYNMNMMQIVFKKKRVATCK